MGQKVSPIGLRVGVIRDWDARWYANDKDFATLLHEDLKIRDYINNKFKRASVSRVEIERAKNRVNIIVHTAKPGMVIGRGGSEKDAAVAQLEKMTGKRVFIRIVEIKRPEVDAQLVANSIAEQLENRASFRRVQKVAIQRAIKFGAKGIKTQVSGRLSTDEGLPILLIGVSPPLGTPRAAPFSYGSIIISAKGRRVISEASEISLRFRALARFGGKVSVAGIFSFQASRRSVNYPFTIRRKNHSFIPPFF